MQYVFSGPHQDPFPHRGSRSSLSRWGYSPPPLFGAFQLRWLALAAALCLLPAAPVCAGSWQLSITGTFTGSTTPATNQGTFTAPNNNAGTITAYTPGSSVGGTCPPGQSLSYSASASTTLTITATWAHNPYMPNETPPTVFQAVEQSTIPCEYPLYMMYATGSGGTDNGFGDPVSAIESTGAHLLQLPCPNATVTWTRTLAGSANAAASVPQGAPAVTITAAVDPGSYTVTVIPAALYGDSTVDTANWDATHPRFFSGTNCKANATGAAMVGYVTDMQLVIGGTIVKEYQDTYANPQAQHQTNVQLLAVFDSTHFGDASNIPINMIITDSGGITYDCTVQANAFNKALVLGNGTVPGYTWPAIALNVASDASAMNHGTSTEISTPTDAAGGDRSSLLGDFPIFTALYGGSHGKTDQSMYFYDLTSTLDGVNNYLLYMTDSDVSNSITHKGTDIPPYNFVHLDACQSGCGNLMAAAFGIPSPAQDQAFLGWNYVVDVDGDLDMWSCALWDSLKAGNTLMNAVRDANRADLGSPNRYDYDTTNNQWDIFILHGEQDKEFGDPNNMTLFNCVYEGIAGQWFR